MDTDTDHLAGIGSSTRRIFRRVLAMGENRLELLLLELEEERDRFVLAIMLALGATIFAVLAGVALTVALAVALWNYSPVEAMLAMAAIYLVAGGLLFYRLAKLRKEWQTLPATLDQLKKDRECLDHIVN